MAEEGVGRVTLHKQDDKGLVSGDNNAAEPVEEKKEDPDELTSADFKKAADDAQNKLSSVAQSAQEGVANALGSLQDTLAPKPSEKQDPEVVDFRASAAEAAAEAKAYMSPSSDSSQPEASEKAAK